MRNETKHKTASFTRYRSPAWHTTTMAVSIFVADMAVMTVLTRFQEVSLPVLFLMDSTLLLLFLFPLLYGLILKPLRAHIEQRKRTEAELRKLLDQLRNLSSHLQVAREEERGHIAREIHDEMGQALTAVKMDIAWLVRRLPDTLCEKGREIALSLDDIIGMVQRISAELRPGLLDDLGLAAAVEWQAKKFVEWSGIDCESVIDFEEERIAPHCATALFRIVQESLTNAARHSGAKRARVKLAERGAVLHVKITDNGRGIAAGSLFAPESMGLAGMRERVLTCGGRLKIRGVTGMGTGVSVSIPLNPDGELR